MRSAIIIGAGPAGLTGARILRDNGVRDVLVLERAPVAGGLPRHCGHPGFGLFDFRRVWTGPSYAERLVEAARGVEIMANATVTRIEPKGRIEVATQAGIEKLEARAVLIATGIRETPRPPRLVSGARPWGVTTTGAFQDMIYVGGMRPFSRPVIVGTELVSFSAILTARHAGIRPAAMIEEGERTVARRPLDIASRALFGVPILTRTRLLRINGLERVESVEIERDGTRSTLACDGVIFTGKFRPDAALVEASPIVFDHLSGGPAIDSAWRCSDPHYFAAGNVLRPVEHSGWVAAEGKSAARSILKALAGALPDAEAAITLRAEGALSYVYPQRLLPEVGPTTIFARAARAHKGVLCLSARGETLAMRRINALPERRLSLTFPGERLRGKKDAVITLD
ncbi:MAG: NAD(P)/FAD-dependent oxidoreductase [Hyphomicrobiales bacterium]|nr:NAD(P)/FAD-dependent oxidoreductase [Hyphomicrobiales bacterium]